MVNNKIKIVVIGNSVPLEMIPCRASKREGVFGELLAKELLNAGYNVELIMRAEHGADITEGLRNLQGNVLQHFPDLVIINYGIVDCTPRLFPKFFVDYVKMPSPWPVEEVIKFLLRKASSFAGYTMLRYVHAGTWVPLRVFRNALGMMIESIKRETAAHVIVLNIPSVHLRKHKDIRGLEANIMKYNDAIASVTQQKYATLVDAFSLVQKTGMAASMPFDFHYNVHGHRVIARDLVLKIGSLMRE